MLTHFLPNRQLQLLGRSRTETTSQVHLCRDRHPAGSHRPHLLPLLLRPLGPRQHHRLSVRQQTPGQSSHVDRRLRLYQHYIVQDLISYHRRCYRYLELGDQHPLPNKYQHIPRESHRLNHLLLSRQQQYRIRQRRPLSWDLSGYRCRRGSRRAPPGRHRRLLSVATPESQARRAGRVGRALRSPWRHATVRRDQHDILLATAVADALARRLPGFDGVQAYAGGGITWRISTF